ncbi:MAG: ABC transporter permease [Clostridia bacterium]|nr:ABC transporter permease [Clostridia bacterium]
MRSIAVFLGGAAFCALIFLFVNPQETVQGIEALLLPGLFSEEGVQKTLLYWPLLILAGVSFGLSWKAGFMNAGIPGQFTVGSLLAMAAALLFSLPWWICLAVAALGGAAWGALAGLLKPRFLLKEVLCAVMLNFIALYLTQWLWEDVFSGIGENAFLQQSAIPALWTGASFSVPMGLPIALVLCAALWAVTRYAVFGYELRAGGSNKEAALRAGMQVDRNVSLAVVLSGGFAGLAGGICLLSGLTDTALSVISNQMGFLGIPVALLSFCHPLGTVFSALAAASVCAGSECLVFPWEAGQILFGFALLGAAVLYRKKGNNQGG